MDQETASYIRNYYSKLMTDDETAALKYHMYTYKTAENPKMRSKLIEKGWITADPAIIGLLNDGYVAFELNVARRIMAETPEEVFLNRCPKCDKLARTPYARQCRCGHSWRD